MLALLAFLPLAVYVAQDSLFYDIARWGGSSQYIELAARANSDAVMTYYGISFGLGSVLGPTLLALALWRAQVIPVWAVLCLIGSLPVAAAILSNSEALA